MLDRKNAPQYNAIEKIEFVKPISNSENSSLAMHSLNMDGANVVKIEIEFAAGTKYQQKPLLASVVSNLLLSGTAKYSAFQIATFFDEEGAFVDTSCNADYGSVVLHCLERSVPKLIPFLAEIINEANFPQKEIDNYKEVYGQKFEVNQQKVAWVARNEFMEFLLGKQHPYSKKLEQSHFYGFSREEVLNYFQEKYVDVPLQIYISGNVSTKVRSAVEENFASSLLDNENPVGGEFTQFDQESEAKELRLSTHQDSVQAAVRLGMVSIPRNDEDFAHLFVANTILGGYFGSRLMSNIREDKGYTYGIGSGVIHLKDLSYFVISTEVGVQFIDDTLVQIELEMKKMQQEQVSEKELETVKNYILGNIMKGFDGAFSSMERFQMLNHHELDFTYYENLVEKIKTITPKQVQSIAAKHLQFNQLKRVIVQ